MAAGTEELGCDEPGREQGTARWVAVRVQKGGRSEAPGAGGDVSAVGVIPVGSVLIDVDSVDVVVVGRVGGRL